jgi:hypothetical protein
LPVFSSTRGAGNHNSSNPNETTEPPFVDSTDASSAVSSDAQDPGNGTDGGPAAQIAVAFLERLRPPPWPLTAIIPDDKTTLTIVTHCAQDVVDFVTQYNGSRNLYYSVNPIRNPINKKAAKTDISAIEYALGDLDPVEGETPEAAKARYSQALATFEFKPTGAIDSGNGIQCLWKIEAISLGEPVVSAPDGKGKTKPIFRPEDQVKVDDAEARIGALMERLGAKAGTQNIDRILRLPGTINLPNAKKLREGRKECSTKLLWFNGAAYDIKVFPLPKPGDKKGKGKKAKAKSRPSDRDDEWDQLERAVKYCDVPDGQTRSHVVWYVINEMLRRGFIEEAIVKTLLNKDNRISDHVYDQMNPQSYAERQIAEAKRRIDLQEDEDGKVLKTAANICVALVKMGVTLRYDRFADQMLVSGLKDFGPVVEDAAVNRIWLLLKRHFGLHVSKDTLFTVVVDIAYTNSFHPVCDYLDATQPTWDGVKRVGGDEAVGWLTTYFGVEDSAYTRAVGRLMLVAAVRRVRQPGCKFDEMLILENPVQGTGRSTALEILAVNEDWYTDDLPLGVRGKELMEAISGKWIVEVGELSGMRKAEVQSVKATLSRRIDRARKAYGRLPTSARRQCVWFGTTNDEEYLRDLTGNRRFWPVLCRLVALIALRRDVHQLWAEAATLEASGISIRLAEELWSVATEEQAKRLPPDEWFTLLKEIFEERGLKPAQSYKISMTSVWTILNIPEHLREHNNSLRVGKAMRALGWRRPNAQGRIRVNGETLSGFIKGESPWTNVTATRSLGQLGVIAEGTTEQDPDEADETDLDGCGPHEGE